MIGRCGRAALAAVAVAVAGCGGAGTNPLVGTWVASMNSGGVAVTETTTFNDDGTSTSTTTAASCSGALQSTGIRWTSTATTITLSGDGTCTGMVTCPDGTTIRCGPRQAVTCDYTLSNGDDTLAITCSGLTTTSTRQG